MAYAEKTSVSPGRSREEIERTLTRYGADGFCYGTDGDQAMVAFRCHGRHIKFSLHLPPRDAKEFTRTPAGRRRRDADAALVAWEQAVRQQWRALGLVIKAKLEAISSGISGFDEEFLAWIVLPDSTTVGQRLLPQVASAYETGQIPSLLPQYAGGSHA